MRPARGGGRPRAPRSTPADRDAARPTGGRWSWPPGPGRSPIGYPATPDRSPVVDAPRPLAGGGPGSPDGPVVVDDPVGGPDRGRRWPSGWRAQGPPVVHRHPGSGRRHPAGPHRRPGRRQRPAASGPGSPAELRPASSAGGRRERSPSTTSGPASGGELGRRACSSTAATACPTTSCTGPAGDPPAAGRRLRRPPHRPRGGPGRPAGARALLGDRRRDAGSHGARRSGERRRAATGTCSRRCGSDR